MKDNSKYNSVKHTIKECMNLIDEEINLHMQGKEANGDTETLNSIKKQFEMMDYYMSPRKYMPSFNYVIRDSLWEYMKIAEYLLDAYYKYLDLDK